QFEGVLPYWVIGSVVAASVITELAPLLTGIALVGIVGARIAAELGAMEVTEQVDALEVIGRDPVTYLVVPRVLAGVLVAPALVALALAASLFAGWAVAVLVTPVSSADFWFGVRYYVRDFPFFFALIKGAAFGLAITFIASYVGLEAQGGSSGVGQATTLAVVAMVSALLVLDTLFAPLLKVVPA
ncbi:MAG: ABC transporter permease, partial [Gemmatimonadetes bacterium]|nr:ABC transporter permease [Gemmatimonadota bacterium]